MNNEILVTITNLIDKHTQNLDEKQKDIHKKNKKNLVILSAINIIGVLVYLSSKYF